MKRKTQLIPFPMLALMWMCVPHLSARNVTDQTGRAVQVPDRPSRLVSLAPGITETLFLLGLGNQVVGVTDSCEYPPEARLKLRVGSTLSPSIEIILTLKPDLVLGSPQANRREMVDQLARVGIPLYGVTSQTVDGTLASIADLGRVLGHEAAAGEVVRQLQARIDAVNRRTAGRKPPHVLFVVWYRPLMTAGTQTFLSDVIRRAGGEPVGADLKGEWPKLSIEEALRLDPDVILFPKTQSFAPDLDEFRTLAGWRDMRAVKEGRLYFVSDTIVRASSRLVDSLEEIARILHPDRGAMPGDAR
ncbi:MAG: cobalamin-binding protein [Acidobacteria bacterium]|nr:cobalamin-binding protein [Acidobacteriota bacterium]